jgi:peroxiredoxin
MRSLLVALTFGLLTMGCGMSATPPPNDGGPNSGGTDDGADGGSAEPTSNGPSAPDFSLPTLGGDYVSLSDYEGEKVVLIDFWATTCDPCLAEMPELVKLYEEKKAQGFEVLAISTDGPETRSQVSQTVSKLNMIFPILLDEETEVMDRYNPKGALPYTAVIDRNGSIVLKRVGYQAGDEASWKSLVNAVETALAQ